MKTIFKRLLAVFSILSVLFAFTACKSKETYNPNYAQYTSPFGEREAVPVTNPSSTPSGELPDDGTPYAPDYSGGSYTTGASGGSGGSGGGSGSGGSVTTTKKSSGGSSGGTVTTTKKAAIAAQPSAGFTMPNLGGSGTLGSLDGIAGALAALGGGSSGSSGDLGGLIGSVSDLIKGLQGAASGSGTATTTPAQNAVTVDLTAAQVIKIYNDAVAKVRADKPKFDKVSGTTVQAESDNPLIHLIGQAAIKFVNEEMKNDSKGVHWPETGSVSDTLFSVTLTSTNVIGMYSKPKQSGNYLFLDIGVADSAVKMPAESTLTTEEIIAAAVKGISAVTSKDVSGTIKWARVYCAIDRSTGQFLALEHDFLLKLSAPGSANYPDPTEFNALLAQGYERFQY